MLIISLSMILDEKAAANRGRKNAEGGDKNNKKYSGNNKNTRDNNNSDRNHNRRKNKQQGLNLRGLEKFMH